MYPYDHMAIVQIADLLQFYNQQTSGQVAINDAPISRAACGAARACARAASMSE
jgi:hypothetical protein